MKAISTLVVVILLLLITISITGIAFLFFQRTITSAAEEAQNETGTKLQQLGKQIRIDNAAGNQIVIRNIGMGKIDLGSEILVYVDKVQKSCSWSIQKLDIDSVATCVLSESCEGKNVKITTSSISLQEKCGTGQIVPAPTTTTTMLGSTTTTIIGATTTTTLSSQQLSIVFVSPTPTSGSTVDSIYVNTSITGSGDLSSFIDFNRSLAGYWDLNNNTLDKSTYGNNGNQINGANCSSSILGKFGSACNFDGIDDYVDIPFSQSLNITNEITIEAWIKGGSEHKNWSRVVTRENVFKLETRNTAMPQAVYFQVRNETSTASAIADGVLDNNWHHVLGTFMPGEIKIYVDSILRNTTTTSITNLNSTINPLRISSSIAFNGTIDEVRIWNRALNEQEIKASFNAGLYKLERNFSNLTLGTYNFYAYVTNQNGEFNRTETRTVTVAVPGAQLIGPGGGGFEIDTLISGTRLLTTVECGGVRASDNSGNSWKEASKGIPIYGNTQNLWKDPNHADTIFVGMDQYILRSTDNGDNWAIVLNSQAQVGQKRPFADFAAKDANTYYAVEGDRRKMFSGPFFENRSVITARIWKSTDGGLTWTQGAQVAINSSDHLSSIYVHPVTKDIYVATTSGGVRKSVDDGISWGDYNTGLSHFTSNRLVAETSNPDILYLTLASDVGQPSKIYRRSIISGDWTDITYNLPTDSDLVDIAVSSSNKVYITNFNYIDGKGGVYRLDGASWTQLTNYTQNMIHGWVADIVSWTKKPSGAAISIDPSNENIIYFTTPLRDQHFKTTDGGVTWEQIYTIKNPDGTWSNRGMSLVGAGSGGIAVDPANSNRIFIGYRDWATLLSEDGGTSWRILRTPIPVGQDINKILIDPANSQNMWIVAGFAESPTNRFGVYYSSNGGYNWIITGGNTSNVNGLPGGWTRDIAIDIDTSPGSRTVYVLVEGQGVYKQVNQTGNWIRIDGPGLPDTTSFDWPLRGIAIDNLRDIIYVGFEKKGSGIGGIYKTSNNGITWENVTGSAPLPAHKSIFYGMYVNPNTGDLYIGAANPSGGAYRLQFGGSAWETLITDSKIQGLHLITGATRDQDVVYISGQDTPLVKWSNGILTNLMSRLPDKVFARGEGVFYDNNTDTLYASIQCGGVYKIPNVS